MIVTPQAGTTLDTVEDYFSYYKSSYKIVDNPGSRRGNREEREKISFEKSRTQMKNSDITLLVLDGSLKPSRQDAQWVEMALRSYKATILAVNKMDLIQDSKEKIKVLKEELQALFHFYPDLQMVFVSAKTGYNRAKLLNSIKIMREKMNRKIPTSELNQFFSKSIRKAPAPVYGTSDVKFYYITQTHTNPLKFRIFANYPKGVTPAYRRFIINQMKSHWNLNGIPIKLHISKKPRSKKELPL